MIQTFRAHNFGCLVDVEATLTPLHAFIGPNDSGKSTLLHGMRTAVQLAGSTFREHAGRWEPFEPHLLLTGATRYPVVIECGVEGGAYAVELDVDRGLREKVSADGNERVQHRSWVHHSAFLASASSPDQRILRQLQPEARLVRFEPDALREPSGLIPERESVGFLDERGHGLPGVYFAIRNRNDDAFAAIVADVRRHFPTVKSLRVKAVTTSEVALEAELVGGTRVEGKRLSEGLLYYLAFAALQHLDPASLLLVEEPENGLHPARISEVMRVLRAIVEESGTQVLMATHSPLVVNELQPEEVSVVTRTADEGTKVRRIRDTPDFEDRFKVYALGELWIAYANGENEAPLLQGTEP